MSFRTFTASSILRVKVLTRTTTLYETLTQFLFLCDTLFQRLKWQSAHVAIVSAVRIFEGAMRTHASAGRGVTVTMG